jgi:O-6-methylguanine DNA methyltransferase
MPVRLHLTVKLPVQVKFDKGSIVSLRLLPVARTQQLPAGLARELCRYFNGKKIKFRTKLDLSSGTAFQQKVWRALQTIPPGQTRSYSWIAKMIGKPRAVRAVGAACGANPVPILVPCHRAVRSDGGLGGFSAGLKWKKRLLEIEAG